MPAWAAVDVGGSRATTSLVVVTRDLLIAECHVWEGDDAVLKVPSAICELNGRYAVDGVVYDPWRFESEALPLEREEGLTAVAVSQEDRAHVLTLVAHRRSRIGGRDRASTVPDEPEATPVEHAEHARRAGGASNPARGAPFARLSTGGLKQVGRRHPNADRCDTLRVVHQEWREGLGPIVRQPG